MYEIINELCKKNNISITKLCEIITNSSGNLATWKKGYMRSDYLQKVAEYFNVSADYLLGLTDNPNSCSSVRNTDTTISGTQINGNQINATPSDSSLAEIETIISKLPKASKYRAIADMLDALEKYT